MRAFNEQQLAIMEDGAAPEVGALVREVRRLYEAEERQAQTNGAVTSMLVGSFQRLQGEARAIEAVGRMLMPAQNPAAPPQEKKLTYLGDSEPQPEKSR